MSVKEKSNGPVLLILTVENIAFKKDTWLNKERHSKRALVSGSKDDLNQKLAEKVRHSKFHNIVAQCNPVSN